MVGRILASYSVWRRSSELSYVTYENRTGAAVTNFLPVTLSEVILITYDFFFDSCKGTVLGAYVVHREWYLLLQIIGSWNAIR